MNIWLINHYAVPPQYYPLARQTNFAKYMMKLGHNVTIFAASTVHNSDRNLIEGREKWRDDYVNGVHYVYIRCRDYTGNGASRILNMCEFAWKLPGVCKHYEKPDAIVATSMPPMSCAVGIHLAKKYKAVGVAEIADLWPESLIAYDIAGPNNPAVVFLRHLEKWIYRKADSIVFTMEGAYDYIVEQGWEKAVPRSKVHFINNGVDLEEFDYNREHYQVQDPDLEDPITYKIVYIGSLRAANRQIYSLFDAIKCMQGPEFGKYRFLFYGKGELVPKLTELCRENHYDNVLIKGFVEKRYIPYILSKCDLNILNCQPNKILRFGGSQNKLFDYLASGHPIISGERPKYSAVAVHKCGVCKEFSSSEELVEAIVEMHDSPPEYAHIRKTAEEYDFKKLTEKLIGIITESRNGND